MLVMFLDKLGYINWIFITKLLNSKICENIRLYKTMWTSLQARCTEIATVTLSFRHRWQIRLLPAAQTDTQTSMIKQKMNPGRQELLWKYVCCGIHKEPRASLTIYPHQFLTRPLRATFRGSPGRRGTSGLIYYERQPPPSFPIYDGVGATRWVPEESIDK